MITVEEAFELVENNVIPTQISILCKTTNALGLVLAEDVSSPINMPPFRQSAMDGYALNIHHGSSYKIIDEVKAGDVHHPILKIGDAVRIFTGSAVPNTANTVVIQEKVTADKNQLQLNNPVKLKENIRSKGEQIKEGDIALKKGTKLTPAAIGFLLTLGIIEVTVFKKPKIGLVITGNELIKAGQPLSYGKIYESNSGMLYTGLLGLGYTDVTQYKVKDDYNSTVMILDKVISENDMILITGGISVGDYDFVGKALLELGTEELPPKLLMGLSKSLKNAPAQIATLLFEKLNTKIEKEKVERIELAGPYLNFFLTKDFFAECIGLEVQKKMKALLLK